MTVPPDEQRDSGAQPEAPLDFDPYRFGAPEHPVPAEYAPPGYRPPAVPREPDLPPIPPPPNYGSVYPPQHATPYPPGYPMPQSVQRSGNGKAVASLVLGVASILLCWLTLFDVVPVVLAVIFGIIALHDVSRDPGRGGRAMAISGIICGAVGAILAIVLTTWFVHLANQCGGLDSSSSQLQQCIRDHI